MNYRLVLKKMRGSMNSFIICVKSNKFNKVLMKLGIIFNLSRIGFKFIFCDLDKLNLWLVKGLEVSFKNFEWLKFLKN